MDPFDTAEEFMEQLLCEQLDRLGCIPRFEAIEHITTILSENDHIPSWKFTEPNWLSEFKVPAGERTGSGMLMLVWQMTQHKMQKLIDDAEAKYTREKQLEALNQKSLKDLRVVFGPLKGCMCVINPFLDEESDCIFIQSPPMKSGGFFRLGCHET